MTQINRKDIKTIGDVDAYRHQHTVNGQTVSRYQTLVSLYGAKEADAVMRNLEVRSWKLDV